MARTYVPDAGDIVWISFNPQTGHEQAGHRPAVVLSPAAYNVKTSLMVCCPRSWQFISRNRQRAHRRWSSQSIPVTPRNSNAFALARAPAVMILV